MEQAIILITDTKYISLNLSLWNSNNSQIQIIHVYCNSHVQENMLFSNRFTSIQSKTMSRFSEFRVSFWHPKTALKNTGLNYHRRHLQAECRKIIEMNTTTVAWWRLANLSQSRELHWTDTLSSEDCNWRKQRPANQLGVHLSAILSGLEDRENFLKSFRWTRTCLLHTEVNVARKNIRCAMVFTQVILRRKANAIKLYEKKCTSEIGMQHAKLEFYWVHYFFRIWENASVHITHCSYRLSFLMKRRVYLLMLIIGL